MKYILTFILLALMTSPVLAAQATARWNPYPTPAGHTLQIQCKINTGAWFRWIKNVDASRTKITKELAIKHKDKLACQIRARRTSDGVYSGWSTTYTSTYNASVSIPDKLNSIKEAN